MPRDRSLQSYLVGDCQFVIRYKPSARIIKGKSRLNGQRKRLFLATWFVLHSADQPPFPLEAQALFYLVAERHIKLQ